MTKVWKKETLTRDTILKLADGPATLAAANSSPYFLHRLAKIFFKDRSVKIVRRRTKKLRELENRDLVKFQKLANDLLKLDLTTKGKIWAKKLFTQEQIANILPQPLQQWSGQWHLLIYDLAKYEKSVRSAFRNAVKGWGMYSMSRNVWVSPSDLEKPLNRLCQTLGINNDQIIYTAAKKISNEETVKNHFRL
jgi:hypothetical protein